MRARLKSEAGLSLVELLTTMVLMGILVPGLALMLTSTVHWTSGSQEEATVQTEARAAIDRMSAEVRQAYSGDTTWPISTIITPTGTGTFTFLTPDRTSPAADGSDPFHVVKVQYRLSGGELQRAAWSSTNTVPNATAPTWTFPGTPAVWSTVLAGIRNTDVFAFKDASNPPVATTLPASVREVDMKVVVGTSTSQGRTYTYQSTATPRLEP
jgi:Tfp pilus assembly protein PilV